MTYEHEIIKAQIRKYFWLVIYFFDTYNTLVNFKQGHIGFGILGIIFTAFAIVWAYVAHTEAQRLRDRLSIIKHKENVDNKHKLD